MPPQELTPPNSYGIFRDWDKSMKRWFTSSYKTELKNVHIGNLK